MSLLHFTCFFVIVCAIQHDASALVFGRIFGGGVGVGGGGGAGGGVGGAGEGDVDGAGGAGGLIDADTSAALKGLGNAGGALAANLKKGVFSAADSGLELGAALARRKAAFMESSGNKISDAVNNIGQGTVRFAAAVPKKLFHSDAAFLRKFADTTTGAKGLVQKLGQQSLNPLDNEAIRGTIDKGMSAAIDLAGELDGALEKGAGLGAAVAGDAQGAVNALLDGSAAGQLGLSASIG